MAVPVHLHCGVMQHPGIELFKLLDIALDGEMLTYMASSRVPHFFASPWCKKKLAYGISQHLDIFSGNQPPGFSIDDNTRNAPYCRCNHG